MGCRTFCNKLLYLIINTVFAITVAWLYMWKTFPKYDTKNIQQNIASEAIKRVRGLKYALTSDLLDDETILGTIRDFSDVLSDPRFQNITIKEAKVAGITRLIYDRINLISNRCKQQHIARQVFYLLGLLREFNIVSKSHLFECHMPILTDVLSSCNNREGFNAVMAVIMTSLTFKDGGLCLKGSAIPLYEYAAGQQYSEVDETVLTLFAIWSDQMTGIHPYDIDGMCMFADRLLKNREKWSIEVKQHFCWFTKKFTCPALSKINIAEYHNSWECRDFLKTTEPQKSESDDL